MAVCALFAPAVSSGVVAGARCDGQGVRIFGRGVPGQLAMTYRVFVPQHHRECRAERGYVTYASSAAATVVQDASVRGAIFWGLDRPLTPDEKAVIEGDVHPPFLFRVSPINQIPIAVDGTAVAVNLACSRVPLTLRSSVLSLIYSGLVTRWDDPLLLPDNPQLAGCRVPIRVAVRADEDHRTSVFTDYLAKRNRQWTIASRTGRWPPTLHAACRGRGESGMATCVAGYPGAIGYVSLAEARRRGVRTALVENGSGQPVAPSPAACTEAAAAATAVYPVMTTDDWSEVSLADAPLGYPICHLHFHLAFKYGAYAYGARVSVGDLRTLVDYLRTVIGAASQSRLVGLGYGALPANLRRLAEAGIEGISPGL
jgi:ABC-type phosphate transport system substrate-binding protein